MSFIPVGVVVGEAERLRERRPELSMEAAMAIAEERLEDIRADAEADYGDQD